MNRWSAPTALVLVAAGVCGAQSAAAAPPEPTEGSFEVAGICPFTVLLEFEGKAKTIERPDGTLILTSPGLVATLTNEESGASKRWSITGAFHVTTQPDGNTVTRTTGRSLLTDPEAGFVVVSGDFSFETAPDGSLVTPLSGTGNTVDVCEALAD